MKKLICALLLLTLAFALVACGPDGKCDECGKDEMVEVYDELDGKEYCPVCGAKAVAEKAAEELEDLLG
ncbi:MAG: hypothetical protein IJW62_07615 [Clostridia bacterium]|nr:hypothetical protein [Clostridia bacterium]